MMLEFVERDRVNEIARMMGHRLFGLLANIAYCAHTGEADVGWAIME